MEVLNLDIKAGVQLRGSAFYLCSQDYGTLCFLPSDRDTLIPHGRLLSTAWSSAECHWHRSPSNRSKSSTPATVRPLRHQPQPNQHAPCEGKRNGREKWEEIFRSLFSLRVAANKTDKGKGKIIVLLTFLSSYFQRFRLFTDQRQKVQKLFAVLPVWAAGKYLNECFS